MDSIDNWMYYTHNEVFGTLLINPEYSDDSNEISLPNSLWQWDRDEYFAFKNDYTERIIGWVRMEFVSDGDILRIKDCGIERK